MQVVELVSNFADTLTVVVDLVGLVADVHAGVVYFYLPHPTHHYRNTNSTHIFCVPYLAHTYSSTPPHLIDSTHRQTVTSIPFIPSHTHTTIGSCIPDFIGPTRRNTSVKVALIASFTHTCATIPYLIVCTVWHTITCVHSESTHTYTLIGSGIPLLVNFTHNDTVPSIHLIPSWTNTLIGAWVPLLVGWAPLNTHRIIPNKPCLTHTRIRVYIPCLVHLASLHTDAQLMRESLPYWTNNQYTIIVHFMISTLAHTNPIYSFLVLVACLHALVIVVELIPLLTYTSRTIVVTIVCTDGDTAIIHRVYLITWTRNINTLVVYSGEPTPTSACSICLSDLVRPTRRNTVLAPLFKSRCTCALVAVPYLVAVAVNNAGINTFIIDLSGGTGIGYAVSIVGSITQLASTYSIHSFLIIHTGNNTNSRLISFVPIHTHT